MINIYKECVGSQYNIKDFNDQNTKIFVIRYNLMSVFNMKYPP